MQGKHKYILIFRDFCRRACAVESAALANPDRDIFVVSNSFLFFRDFKVFIQTFFQPLALCESCWISGR